MSSNVRRPRQRAVVVGASLAGLSSAAVLADRFDEVVVVERDDLPTSPRERRGVPQGRHAHALLPGGLTRLEGWFPGLTEQLVSDGAAYLDIGKDVLWHQGGGLRRTFVSGVKGPVASRALIEHHVRRRALALPNVTLRTAGAVGATFSHDGRMVTGLELDDGTVIGADLVVDASGRPGRSLRWLAAKGYEEPPTSVVKVDVAYASRVLHRDTQRNSWWQVAMIMAGPPTGRLAVAVPVEGDRWIVTLAGLHGDHPPKDDAGFLRFARSLPSPEIADLLEQAPPLTDVVTHHLPSNQRRHPERLRRLPAGLVMLGDALCSFNPTYGQGMSTAALQAEALGQTLDRVPTLDQRFVRSFYRQAAKAITPAWQLATGADFSLPATTGPKVPGTDLLNRYMPHVFRASHVSQDVAQAVVEVASLVRPPQALLTPTLMTKVLFAARFSSPPRTRSNAPSAASQAPHPLPLKAPLRSGSRIR